MTILYCTYCGSNINEEETYCVSCGKQLQKDINHRQKYKRKLNKLWFIPISLVMLLLLSFSIYYLLLQNRTSQAKELYEQGEEYLLKENYDQAEESFKEALKHKKHFTQATIALNYIEQAKVADSIINETTHELADENYDQALSLVDEAEKLVNNYNGTVVSQLINTLSSHRNN